MPTSRGSIHHAIRSDCAALVSSFVKSQSCAPPSSLIREHAETFIATFFGAKHSVLFPYARTSFYAILKSLELAPGTEVLMTPFNISPMLHIVYELGLRPRFIDINLSDFGPDYDALEAALSAKPGCFLLTYLFGFIPDIRRIASLCHQYQVFLVEDISQGVGGTFDNRYLGTFGDAAIFSASITKYVDGYNGAFVLTSNDKLCMRLKAFVAGLSNPRPKRIRSIIQKTLLWNIALSRHVFNCFTYPLLFILKSISRTTFDAVLGPSIQADFTEALPDYYFEDIASIQVGSIVSYVRKLNTLISCRRYYASRLIHALSSLNSSSSPRVSLPTSLSIESSTYWQFLVFVGNTKEAQSKLFKAGVETGITNLPNLAELCGVSLVNAKTLKDECIFIPLHAHLRSSDYKSIIKLLS